MGLRVFGAVTQAGFYSPYTRAQPSDFREQLRFDGPRRPRRALARRGRGPDPRLGHFVSRGPLRQQ
jgi:hypothetical protein